MGVAEPRTGGCLFYDEMAMCIASVGQDEASLLHVGWRPGSQLRGLCTAPALSRVWNGWHHLEIAGIDEDDSIHWTELDYRNLEQPILGGGASSDQEKYLATCLLRPGALAGVTGHGVVWLRRDGHRLRYEGMTPAALENAVACAISLPTRELLVICRDGVVVRVPLPN
jgi:hypothetical protein